MVRGGKPPGPGRAADALHELREEDVPVASVETELAQPEERDRADEEAGRLVNEDEIRSQALAAVEGNGIVFIEDDGWKGGPFPDFYHSTFHAPWYVFQHWTRFFDLKAYVVRGSLDFQDYLLLRRPAGPLPPLPVEAATPEPAKGTATFGTPVAPPGLPRRALRALKRRLGG